MKKTLIMLSLCVATVLTAAGSASALQCGPLTLPNSLAVSLLNTQVSGLSYRISKRKTLVINRIESMSGTNCNVSAKVNVTLKRRIRRDAKGTISVRGTLKQQGGKLCIESAKVTNVDLSNTLNIGEAAYKWAANKALPSNFCF